jgi:hypothetical protein
MIDFGVAIRNESEQLVVACVETWDSPAGIVTLEFFDEDRERVLGSKWARPVSRWVPSDHLELLKPGEKRVGTLRAGIPEELEDKPRMWIQAVYFCPASKQEASALAAGVPLAAGVARSRMQRVGGAIY